MAASELSIDLILQYFIEKDGVVANREVVKHFKSYLTDPATKDDARVKFKKYINTLATTKTESDEKVLILRPKYASYLEGRQPSSAHLSPYHDPRNSVGIPVSPSLSIQDFSPVHHNSSSPRQPPPYRPPPPPPTTSPNTTIDISICSANNSIQDPNTPQAPPRRRSTEKGKTESEVSEISMTIDENTKNEQGDVQINEIDKQPISVKERTQKFNRMASVDDEISPRPQKEKKKLLDKGADEDDGALLPSLQLDPKKSAEWFVTAAKGDYQELAKLASDDPRLVTLRDPFTAYTVLHWGAKHGNENIIKLFAGKYRVDVNSKTNGGYTPLHMAVQFGHKKVYSLLIEVYDANPEIRDYSGRKPNQYQTSQTQTASKDTYKKSRKKLSDKDLRFLRIGSLNVRVKKTTEAFSNFLGVGGGSVVNPVDNLTEKVHKSWGSADNLSQENLMPAPKGYVSKKKLKKSLEFSGANSTPGTPNQTPRSLTSRGSIQDSDSDSAAGFDSQWQN